MVVEQKGPKARTATNQPPFGALSWPLVLVQARLLDARRGFVMLHTIRERFRMVAPCPTASVNSLVQNHARLTYHHPHAVSGVRHWQSAPGAGSERLDSSISLLYCGFETSSDGKPSPVQDGPYRGVITLLKSPEILSLNGPRLLVVSSSASGCTSCIRLVKIGQGPPILGMASLWRHSPR